MSFTEYEPQKHDRDMFRCYKLNDAIYVPTYNEAGIFIGPCGKKYLESDLIRNGCMPVMESLYTTAARREG
jgi:hypothetical protein